jgi:hypothetical protein
MKFLLRPSTNRIQRTPPPTMFTSPRLLKAAYTFIAGIILVVIGLWFSGPTIIEQVYYGTSLPFLNSIITGQKEHELSEYMSLFYHNVMWFTATIILLIVALINFLWSIKIKQQQLEDNNRYDQALNTSSIIIIFGYSLLIVISLFVFLVLSGKTYLSIMTHDTFVFYDGAYRLSVGQTPHIDFHTPLGSATYLLAYWGFLLRGKFAGSLELASFLVITVLTLFSILLLWGRSSPLFSVLTILFLCLLAAVPMNVGAPGTITTHAMYYNRWAWAALTLVLVTYIMPKTYTKNRVAWEAILLACLIVFLFFLKVTYFIFALMFLFVLGFASHRQKQLAISAGVITLVIWALIEWEFRITLPYVGDVQSAMAASGAVRSGLLYSVEFNAGEYLLVLAALSILILNKAVRWQDFLFVGLVSAAGLLILNQNAQSKNIVVILAVLLWSYAAAVKGNGSNDSHARSIYTGNARVMSILLLLFMAPCLISRIHGLYSFTRGVATNGQQNQIATLPGVYIGEGSSYLDEIHVNANPILLFNELRLRRPLQPLSQGEYVQTINEGLRLLASHNVQSGKILTFDLANPFNFLSGGPPSKGDYSWFHAGRNISRNAHISASDLFEDVNYIMLPTFPMNYETTRLLLEIYGEHLERAYALIGKTKCWTLYGRRRT